MDCFDSTVEDWSAYVERLEQYCVANEVEDERKVAVLLSLMELGHTIFYVASQYQISRLRKRYNRMWIW